MNDIKFSLCIPTMNRFDSFLKQNLKIYLEIPFIDEIVICDETGDDYNKVLEYFPNEIKTNKIRIFKNNNILGPFKNKLKVCSQSKNEWIALIDSDNFASVTYFVNIINYIKFNKLNKYSILSPCFAKPNFDYRTLENKIITKKNLKEVKLNDTKNVLTTLMNTGNYVLNKNLIDNLDTSKEENNIKRSSSADVIYINTLFFEQYKDFEFHVINNLHYEHTVHSGSIYITTCQNNIVFDKQVHTRFENLYR